MEWLTDLVPDESGGRVPNPISLVSRWKILDNLRRSLVEPATFVLLLFGWLVMGHPVLWTLATICILFVPAWGEFGFGLVRAVAARQLRMAGDALSNLFSANFTVLLTLTLLAHQTLLSLDAVLRALVRRVTHAVSYTHLDVYKRQDLLWLRDNAQLLRSGTRGAASELGPLTDLPHVTSKGEIIPRVLAITQGFFDETDFTFGEDKFAEFCIAFEEITPLQFHEIGALVPSLKLVLLEQIATRGSALIKDPTNKPHKRVTTCIRSLESVMQASWADVLEPVSYTHLDVYKRQSESWTRTAPRSVTGLCQPISATATAASIRTTNKAIQPSIL